MAQRAAIRDYPYARSALVDDLEPLVIIVMDGKEFSISLDEARQLANDLWRSINLAVDAQRWRSRPSFKGQRKRLLLG